MGQYWTAVNLDKCEFVNAHKLAVGLKLGEQIGSGHGTPDAIFILTAAMRGRRGGGDFDWDSNYHGPERDFSKPGHGVNGAPVVEDYNEVAKRTIGRWAGDRIAIVGDYATDEDLPGVTYKTEKGEFGASQIYGMCADGKYVKEAMNEYGMVFKDVTGDVARVIEHEVGGRYIGEGWKSFVRKGSEVSRWRGNTQESGKVTSIAPDVVIEWPNETKTYDPAMQPEFF